jgi:hypothetical protein
VVIVDLGESSSSVNLKRRCRTLFSLAALMMSACSRGDAARLTEVATAARGAPPFDSLSGVWLGMRADELLERRPRVQVSGYHGYRERIGTHDVSYRIPGSMSEEQAPPRRARLEAVVASRQLPESSDAAASWRAGIADLRTRLGEPTDCFRLAWPVGEAWLAVWRRGDADVYFLGQPRFGARSPTPASLRLGVTGRGQSERDVGGTAARAKCDVR